MQPARVLTHKNSYLILNLK